MDKKALLTLAFMFSASAPQLARALNWDDLKVRPADSYHPEQQVSSPGLPGLGKSPQTSPQSLAPRSGKVTPYAVAICRDEFGRTYHSHEPGYKHCLESPRSPGAQHPADSKQFKFLQFGIIFRK